jgi:hypothetical protein
MNTRLRKDFILQLPDNQDKLTVAAMKAVAQIVKTIAKPDDPAGGNVLLPLPNRPGTTEPSETGRPARQVRFLPATRRSRLGSSAQGTSSPPQRHDALFGV